MSIFCNKNHLAYDKERDIAAPYIATPKQFYDEYKQSHNTLANSLNPSSFIRTLDELFQSDSMTNINSFLNMPINLPELDINGNKFFKELDNIKTLKDLIFEGLNFIYNIINDKETYLTLRDKLKNYAITHTLEPSNVIPSINQLLKKIGVEKSFMDIVFFQLGGEKLCQQNKDLSYFILVYTLLDTFYKPDKLPKDSNNAINIITDAMHAYYGAYCDYIVTDDKKFAEKARVLFHEFNIDVPIISSNELISTLSSILWNSQNDAIKDISELFAATGLCDKNIKYNISENNDNSNWIVALDKYYFNFFNQACVYKGKYELEGIICIQLLRRFKGLSHYIFYSEVENLLNLLSKTFGPIPELQKQAIINCQENALYVWKNDDESMLIIIHEDNTYKGRPELDFIIKTKNSNYPN